MKAASKVNPVQVDPSDGHIEAWIDVGGTFTDCYVKLPGAPLIRSKQLSSGLVPVSLRAGGDKLEVHAPELSGDPDGFWNGSSLRAMNFRGESIAESRIAYFRQADARLILENPLPIPSGETDPDRATAFEIIAGIEASVLAVRRSLGCSIQQPLPKLKVRLGTTRGTNALLTRRGERMVLAITAPFEDLLKIGDQTRPHLFDLAIRRDDNLASETIGVRERLDAQGKILEPLDIEHTQQQLRTAFDAGFRSLAICLLHSYVNPAHELAIEKLALDMGFEHVSRSSQLAPLIEIVARARTTVVDAYLGPIVRSYFAVLVEQFGGADNVQLDVMTSAGGLIDWRSYAGKDCILSGPAGGVVALRGISEAMRMKRLVGLDMGGTSTDVCRIGPEQTLEYESTKAGVRILTPTLPIETVASGGGSICWFDGVSLRVGPQSAGATPGPACYGRGGPLTITDLNVLSGRLPPSQFPFPLDEQAAQRRLDELTQEAILGGLEFESSEQLAHGLRAIANQQMAEAVRTVSIAQGADPRKHALVGFGGAAGQHICEIAELLSVRAIIDSAEAGLLSALGMGLAAQRRDAAIPIYRQLDQVSWNELSTLAALKLQELGEAMSSGSSGGGELQSSIWLQIRYAGTDVALPIAWNQESSVVPLSASESRELSAAMRAEFHREHVRRFGYNRPKRAMELVAVRVELVSVSREKLATAVPLGEEEIRELPTCDRATRPTFTGGAWRHVPLIRRTEFEPGCYLVGPAIVLNEGSTLMIDEGWNAVTFSDGTLYIRKNRAKHQTSATPASQVTIQTAHHSESQADPTAQAVFAQRLSAIATQMGLVLQQTAVSVNVKQRRDFSCAIFDCEGQLLASAPHVPVHLGAMGETVRAARRLFPDLAPGDVIITNDPYQGGSHLPDVTVISGIFESGNLRPQMFVANRAHHADIGGIVPGSMSVSATKLGEEGVIIVPLRMSAAQCADLEPLRQVLASATYPPRNMDENIADLRAQLAANARGNELLQDVAASFRWPSVAQLCEAVLEMARRRVIQFICTLPFEPKRFTDHLDDGTVIEVLIERTVDNRLVIDFAGTGPVSRHNFNANPSIVTAAIIYVLRCLIADDLPLNEGIMRAVDLRIPNGVLRPEPAVLRSESPAVAAGNVETSQRVVDVLLGALEAAAASQGTMNNLLFGNTNFGFYETICGGAGALAGCDGASGVHTHMTNTRLTDPEILEARYRVRLLRFGLRSGSGGNGKWRGGDGVVRTIQFLEPVQLSLLTSRRGTFAPYGLQGGEAGMPGVNRLIRLSGEIETLPGCCQIELVEGEAIEIETPGGGGYGHA